MCRVSELMCRSIPLDRVDRMGETVVDLACVGMFPLWFGLKGKCSDARREDWNAKHEIRSESKKVVLSCYFTSNA